MNENTALAGCYQVYKDQTTRIAEYLARTASQSCDISKILASLKNNGRNRRLAEVGGTVPVQTAEFVLLARAIADANPPVPISRGVLTLVRKAINRRQCVSDVITADRQHLTDDDLRHLHFIDVLREVYRVLEEASQRASHAQRDPAIDDAGSAEGTLTTVFSKLELEESADEPITAPQLSLGINLAKVKFTCVAKELKSTRFRLLCHLQDLYEMRKSVHESWLAYNKGEVSHMHASMATTSAIALIKCANAEFVAIHPRLETFDQINQKLNLAGANCTDNTDTWLYKADIDEPTSGESENFDLPQLLCWHGAELLAMVEDKLSKSMGVHNPNSNRGIGSKLISKLASHPFAILLLTELNMMPLLYSGQDLGQGDILTGINKAWLEGERPMWVCSVLQMFMDICDITSSNIDRGIGHLKRILRKAEEQRAAFNAFRAQSSRPKAFEQAADRLELQARLAHAALQRLESQSPTIELLKKLKNGGHLSLSEKKLMENFRSSGNDVVSGTESQIPGLAGAATYEFSRSMSVAGCFASNTERLLQCMAFLYRAAKRFGLVTSDWQDMEFVISSRSSTDGPLVPKMKANSTAKEYQKHLENSIGLRIDPRLIGTYRNSFITFQGTKAIGMPGDYFAAKHSEKSNLCSKGIGNDGKAIQIALHELRIQQGNKPSVQVPGQREIFTPLELHETFKKTFARDEPYLNFDWVALWLKCAPLLQSMHAAARPETHAGLHDQLMIMAYELMLQLVIDERDAEDLSESPSAKAGKILNEYIKSHGQDFRKAAFKQSSGKIPKSLKPKIGQSVFQADAEFLEELRGMITPESSVAGSRDMLVFYHPQLERHGVRRDEHGHLVLPLFMKPKVDRSDGKDTQE